MVNHAMKNDTPRLLIIFDTLCMLMYKDGKRGDLRRTERYCARRNREIVKERERVMAGRRACERRQHAMMSTEHVTLCHSLHLEQ